MAHVFIQSNNSVAILICSQETNISEEINKIKISTNWTYAGDISIPESQYFRDCWTWDFTSASVIIDIEKAKQQKLKEIRYKRNKLLTETDSLMARANEIEIEEEINKLKKYRQQLRDLPKNAENIINKIINIEDLEKININDILRDL